MTFELTRRDFIKTGSVGLVSCLLNSYNCHNMKNQTSKHSFPYEDRFGLSDDDLSKILNIALSRGGDFSEIYLEYTHFISIVMEEDIIKETTESISTGMGIRVLSGDMTGYGYTNEFDFEKIKSAALTAAAIASRDDLRSANPPRLQNNLLDLYPVLVPVHTQILERKIDLVRRAYSASQKHDPLILKVKAALAEQLKTVCVVNSDGLKVRDTRPMTRLICLAIAEKDGVRESGYSGGGGRVGMEYFQNQLTPEEIGANAAREAVNLVRARPAPAGEMPVVLAPGHSGVMIHEAVGHLLEADFIRKKTSIFWNKIGKKVGSDQVTIYDDPTIPLFRGSYNYDDEGTTPQKTPLILNGVCTGLLHDRLSAGLMGESMNGHGRRQNFSCIPIPRMSNTYLDRGEYDPNEIIHSVKKGFYAQFYQGGQVEDSGKFTFSVSSGYLIENGRLTAPVKQATLIGTNIDILKKISMVGSDLQFGLQTGTCGKEGQAAPVTDGCPTVKISMMTVGGTS